MTSHERELESADLPQLLGRVASDHRRTADLHHALRWYCHESRNSLNSLKMSIYLAKRSGGAAAAGTWSDVETRYAEVERYIDRLHRLCRPTELSPIRAPLDLLFDERKEAWQAALSSRGRRLELVPPERPAVGSFDPVLFAVALDDLVVWRSRRGAPGAVLRVGWSTDGAALRVVWSESAACGAAPPRCPAAPPSDSEADTTVPVPVTAFGREEPDALELFCLPLLTRVVTLHGGTVESNPGACWRLGFRWPADAR